MAVQSPMLSGAAALVVTGAAFAVPALAQDNAPAGQAGPGFRMMHAMGDMTAMHNVMMPLRNRMPAMHDQVMGDVAGQLGMSLDELSQALKEKSLAAIAEEKGSQAEARGKSARRTGRLSTGVHQAQSTQPHPRAMRSQHPPSQVSTMTGSSWPSAGAGPGCNPLCRTGRRVPSQVHHTTQLWRKCASVSRRPAFRQRSKLGKQRTRVLHNSKVHCV
jgi:hypothetical protein